MSGVTARTLHHYEAIGLLVPSGRSRAGYRLYGDADLLRLQQILIRRELGFSLEDIRRALDDANFDHRSALLSQRRSLEAHAQATERKLQAIDAALAALTTKEGTDTMSMQSIFDGFEPAKHEAEAKQRWGGTDAFAISSKRTKAYTPAQWAACKSEQDAIYRDVAAAMASGLAADHSDVRAIAERHRLSIDRWFYPCSAQMHAGLADLYEADARFAANIDRFGVGLTPYFAAAIRANAGMSQT